MSIIKWCIAVTSWGPVSNEFHCLNKQWNTNSVSSAGAQSLPEHYVLPYYGPFACRFIWPDTNYFLCMCHNIGYWSDLGNLNGKRNLNVRFMDGFNYEYYKYLATRGGSLSRCWLSSTGKRKFIWSLGATWGDLGCKNEWPMSMSDKAYVVISHSI